LFVSVNIGETGENFSQTNRQGLHNIWPTTYCVSYELQAPIRSGLAMQSALRADLRSPSLLACNSLRNTR